MLKRFWKDEGGATSIEYAFIATMISVLIIAGARSIGVNLSTKYFAKVSSNLT